MKWKLPPKREQQVLDLIEELAGVLEKDIGAMSESFEKRRSQAMVEIIRPYINLQLPNVGKSTAVDRRTKAWRVKCMFGYFSGKPDMADDGEFEWEETQGFDGVMGLVRACFDDFHAEERDMKWEAVSELQDKPMRQRFGGLYSNISKGGGEAGTRIFYETPEGVDMYIDVLVMRGENSLDPATTNGDSPNPGTARLRAMREEARGKS